MIYALILAGGVGSRFWPFSRELEPKQLMKIIGEKSLLQATVERVRSMILPGNIFIVTNSVYFHEIKSQVCGTGIPDENIILEPQGKNTAPAIGLCARIISQVDPEAVLVVLPADHYIKGVNGFRSTLKKAILAANQGKLVTIGIRPDKPATGYGYIRIKSGVKSQKSKIYSVDKFLEKPDLNKARKYFKDKNFFWNSGMFVWRSGVFLDEVKKFLPGLHKSLMSMRNITDIKRVWPGIEPISVDYGVMERSGKIAMVNADFFWADLGSWDALGEILPKDARGNILSEGTVSLSSKGTYVFNRANRLICTIGTNDLVIADTPDALLVCARARTQEVKGLVGMLKSLNRREHFSHLTEKRPWGTFTVLQSGPGFKIKLIEIGPGKRLSLQRHKKRAEHWVVVSGKAKVRRAGKIITLCPNESTYIPRGVKHQLSNIGNAP